MSKHVRWQRWLVAGVVLASSAALGAWVAAGLGPERLRLEVERQVTAATGAPCTIRDLRVAPGLPIEIEIRDAALWDGSLRVPRARARVSIAAAIVGEVRLSRLVLETPTLTVSPREDDLPPEPPPPDAPTQPLAALRKVTDDALAALALADQLLIRNGRVEVDRRGAEPFTLHDIHGRLAHHRLRGERRLVAQARIASRGTHRGLVEWNGTRVDDEPTRLSLAVTELDLSWLGESIPGFDPGLSGWLSGVVDFALAADERATLELDWVGRDFAWQASDEDDALLSLPRVNVLARVDVEPRRLVLKGARVRGGPIDATVDARAERPLRPSSRFDLRVRSADLSLEALRELFTSMPTPWVSDARDALFALDAGRVVSFDAHARGKLADWRPDTGAKTRGLPPGLDLSARLADLRIHLEDDDAIEDIALRARWSGDSIALNDVVGSHAGLPLPRLDLEIDNVSRLLDARLDERAPPARDVHLAGLPLLLSLFEPKPDQRRRAPNIAVRLSHLDHPAMLWPVRSLDLQIRDGGDRLLGEIVRGTWAGVPLRGELAWNSQPMHLKAQLEVLDVFEAPAPDGTSAVQPATGGLPLEGRLWAEGHFEIGFLASNIWSHQRLRGRVRAARSEIAFDEIVADTLPSGRITGNALLDLSEGEALPYRAVFEAKGLDADALFAQAGLGRGLVAGRVDGEGDLRTRYQPGVHPNAALNGNLHLLARNGHVRQNLPAVLALALAGEGLDLRNDREVVRYTTCESRLVLRDGIATTDALEFEGPDVRMFGSGSLDLGHPPHALDSEVAVFLFRPVDRVLGAMPIVGNLILGGSDNLLAAYFELDGPWNAPTATYRPLRSLNTGPLRLVTGLPSVVQRGIEALGQGISNGTPAPELAPPPGDAAP